MNLLNFSVGLFTEADHSTLMRARRGLRQTSASCAHLGRRVCCEAAEGGQPVRVALVMSSEATVGDSMDRRRPV
jgi:hypothetical protein